MKMEQRIWLGLLSSLALHMALLGMWWTQVAYVPGAMSASPENPTIEIYLQNAANAASTHSSAVTPGDSASSVVEPTEQAPDAVFASAPQTLPPESRGMLPLREAPYIPAGELDEHPSPETPVIVPFPDTVVLQEEKVEGILVLYIGADGRVDRVEVDESDLPPELENAAISTFLHARMRPGIRNGQATRARMKVLVEFEQR